MAPAVTTEKLSRIFKAKIPGGKTNKTITLIALDDIDLEIQSGELFGLLGPNGAGKTTLIRILSTLLLPSSGKALVCGLDVETHPQKIRSLINMVCGGETSGYGMLTVRESLWVFSQVYGIPYKEAFGKIDNLLDIVDLKEKSNVKFHDLSSGMKQKINFIRGFLNDPKVLFLDEPTLGLDVHTARGVRAFVKDWMKEDISRTVLLTTHYIHEAEQICDRIAIIHRGKIIACDTPDKLKKLIPGQIKLEIIIQSVNGKLPSWEDIPDIILSEEKKTENQSKCKFLLKDEISINHIINRMITSEAMIISMHKQEPNLEDVFVALTGKSLSEEETEVSPEP